MSRKAEVEKILQDLENQLPAAQAALEAADDAIAAYKLRQIEGQRAEAKARPGTLPRAQFFVIEKSTELEHLEYERKRAVGARADIERRIKAAQQALFLIEQGR